MSANPQAARIAREIGRRYDDVRRALNILTNDGWSPHDAEVFVREAATRERTTGEFGSLVDAAHLAASGGREAPDTKEPTDA